MPVATGVVSIAFVLEVIHNAIDLVFLCTSLPPSNQFQSSLGESPFLHSFPHSIHTSAPQLLGLLLDSVGDPTHVSPAESARMLTRLTEVSHLHLPLDALHRITTWSAHFGFAALQASDALFGGVQSMDISAPSGHTGTSSSSQSTDANALLFTFAARALVSRHVCATDFATFHLAVSTFQVQDRATTGASNEHAALSSLLALYQQIGCDSTGFITTFLQTNLHLLCRTAQFADALTSGFIWRAFIVGRVRITPFVSYSPFSSLAVLMYLLCFLSELFVSYVGSCPCCWPSWERSWKNQPNSNRAQIL